MTFVNQKARRRLKALFAPTVRRLVNDNTAPGMICFILLNTTDIKRYSPQIFTAVPDHRLNVAPIIKCVFAVKIYLENTAVKPIKLQSIRIPCHHVSCKKDLVGGGSPLAIHPTVTGSVKSEIHVPIGKFGKTAAIPHKLGSLSSVILHTELYVVLIGQEERVVFKYFIFHKALLSVSAPLPLRIIA
jgi:hypothetical protein